MLLPGLGVGAAVGVVMSIVGAIPILNICTFACCLYVAAAGFIAAFLYGKREKTPFIGLSL